MTKKPTSKIVKIFAIASFLNDLGSDMIYPIWPLFLTGVLGANMAILGFIDGLGDAIVSISQAISGYLSDKTKKRKIFIWLGYTCGALSRIGYAFSTTWQHIIPFRVLDRAGKMRGSPRDAMIADLSQKENRGKHFGLLRTMDNLGAVCGIIICILFFKILGYQNFFLLASIPSIIAVILILFTIKEAKPESKIFKGFAFKNLNKNFRLLTVLSTVFALGSFSYSFLLIYARTAGFEITFVPVLYLIFTAFAAMSSLPFGKLCDKIGRKPVLLISFLLWGLVCLSSIFSLNHLGVIITFILYGLHKGALETSQKTLVSELAPAEYRASGLGSFQMVIGLCALPASYFAGVIWDKLNMYAPFYFSLGLTIVASLLLFFVKEPSSETKI